MAVQHFANMFFFCTRLDHYSPECSSIAPCTNIINLSIIFVHSPPFHPPPFFESFSPSLVPSPSLFFPTVMSETNDGTDESFHAIYPTHCILISQLFGVVCSFLHWCFPNHNPAPHPPLLWTHNQKKVFFKLHHSASLICECLGLVCPRVSLVGAAPLWMRASAFRHAALWAMINLWELSS